MKFAPPRHTTQTCHWSVPTLLMPAPYWTAAWDAPWSCWNDREVRLLPTTTFCRQCPLWTPRAAGHGLSGPIQPEGAVPLPPDGPIPLPPNDDD